MKWKLNNSLLCNTHMASTPNFDFKLLRCQQSLLIIDYILLMYMVSNSHLVVMFEDYPELSQDCYHTLTLSSGQQYSSIPIYVY